ncbi:MAG: hypothetical protein ACR2HR_07105 [Euzebya sp.]
MQIIVTALLSSASTAVAMYLLWRLVLVPDLEQRAREMAQQATANASAELTAAGEALVPQFRKAVRDGIQDAVLLPPTDRIGQTARGMTTAGVNVVESSLRRIFGTPTPRE